jgi:hypothetical protein
MSQIDDIRSGIQGLQGWKLAAFALGCAERIAPVFRLLALPGSVAVFDNSLEFAWMEVNGRSQVPQHIIPTILALPEAFMDDSNCREYYATLALGVLEHALHGVVGDNSHESTDMACCQALDIFNSLDGIATGSPCRVADAIMPTLPMGELEASEITVQLETLRILGSISDDRERICGYLQTNSREMSRTLETILPTLIRQRYGE